MKMAVITLPCSHFLLSQVRNDFKPLNKTDKCHGSDFDPYLDKIQCVYAKTKLYFSRVRVWKPCINGNLISPFFGKNFVNSTHLLKKLLDI